LLCRKMQGNNANEASTTATYYACYCDAGTSVAVTEDTAASGWNTP
jgi:hypothetical protein